jgi:hypothetical protein
MRVKLKATPYTFNDYQNDRIFNKCPDITKGREYTVFGISLIRGSDDFYSVYYTVEDDHGLVLETPKQIWDVTDDKVDSDWRVTETRNGSTRIENKLFSVDGYIDKLTDFDPDALKQFNELKMSMMKKENIA